MKPKLLGVVAAAGPALMLLVPWGLLVPPKTPAGRRRRLSATRLARQWS